MYGFLRLLRPNKVNKQCPQYELEEGDHTIGTHKSCNIHLSLKQVSQDFPLGVYAVVKVQKDGVAIIHAQSNGAPVTLNDKRLTSKPQILLDGVKIKVVEKEFQYVNERFKDLAEDAKIRLLRQNQDSGRKSVPLLGSTKDTASFKTKIKSPPKTATPLNRSLMNRPTARPTVQRTLNLSTTKTPLSKIHVKRNTLTPRVTLPAKSFTSTSSVKKQGTPYKLSGIPQRLTVKKPSFKVENGSESDLANELSDDQIVKKRSSVAAKNISLRLSRSIKAENVSMSEVHGISEDEEAPQFDASRKSRSFKQSLGSQEAHSSKRYSRSTATFDPAKQEMEEQNNESGSELSDSDKKPSPRNSHMSSRRSQGLGNSSKDQKEAFEQESLEEADTSTENLHHSHKTSDKSLSYVESAPRTSSRFSKHYQPVIDSTTNNQSDSETSGNEEIDNGGNVSSQSQRRSYSSRKTSSPRKSLREAHHEVSEDDEIQNNESHSSLEQDDRINVSSRLYRISSPRKSRKVDGNHDEDSNDEVFENNEARSRRDTLSRRSVKSQEDKDQYESLDEEAANISSRSERTTSPRKSLKSVMNNEELANMSSQSQRTSSPRKSLNVNREKAVEQNLSRSQRNNLSNQSLESQSEQDHSGLSEDEETAEDQINVLSTSRRTTLARKSLNATSDQVLANISSKSQKINTPRKSLKSLREENNQTNISPKTQENNLLKFQSEQDLSDSSEDVETADDQKNMVSTSRRTTFSRKSLNATGDKGLVNVSSRSQRTNSPRKSLKASREDNQTNISSRSQRNDISNQSLRFQSENHSDSSTDEGTPKDQKNVLSTSRRNTYPRKSLHAANDEAIANVSSGSQRNHSPRKSLKMTREGDVENRQSSSYKTSLRRILKVSRDEEFESNDISLRSQRNSLTRGSVKENQSFSSEEDEAADAQINVLLVSRRTTSSRKSLKAANEDLANVSSKSQKSLSGSYRTSSPKKSLKATTDMDNYESSENEDASYDQAHTSSRSHRTSSVRKSLNIKKEHEYHQTAEVSNQANSEDEEVHLLESNMSSRNISPRKSLRVTWVEGTANPSPRESLKNTREIDINESSEDETNNSARKSFPENTSVRRSIKLTENPEVVSRKSHLDMNASRNSYRRSNVNVSQSRPSFAEEVVEPTTSSTSRVSYRQSQGDASNAFSHKNYSRKTLPAQLMETSSKSSKIRRSESGIPLHHDIKSSSISTLALSDYQEADKDVFMSVNEVSPATQKSLNDSLRKSRRETTGSKLNTSDSGNASLRSNLDNNSINTQSNLTQDELLVNRTGRRSYSRRQYSSDADSDEGRRSRYVTARKPVAKINTSSMIQNYDSDEPSPDFSLVTENEYDNENEIRQSMLVQSSRETSADVRRKSTFDESTMDADPDRSRRTTSKRQSTFDESAQDANKGVNRSKEASRRNTFKRQSTFDESTQDANTRRPATFDASTQEANSELFGSASKEASRRATSKRQSTFDESTQDANIEYNRFASKDVSRRATPKRQSTFDESTQEAIRSASKDSSRRATFKRQSTFDESTQEANSQAFRSASSRKATPKRQSTFDESTQDANLEAFKPETSKRASSRRQSTFDESTQDAQMLNASTSQKAITIYDDTVEVLSPVQPVVSRMSGRKSQNESSLTNTQMSQSSSSVMSVSSQSFSSFKKGHSQMDSKQDVLDSSASDARRKSSVNDGTPKQDGHSTRFASEIFEAVSFTSTPFPKSVGFKKSLGSAKKSLLQVTKQTSVIQTEVLVSSMEVTSNFSNIGASPSVIEISDSTVRRSRRSSTTRNGHHNCISCRESSSKRSRSLSDVRDFSLTIDHKSEDLSKSASVSLARHSSIKDVNSSPKNSPLLHRKSLVSSVLSVHTPEKQVESEDETPKSHVKPTRRSSKANQSAYNPVLEDITPVTPERMQVSGFTEAFKTPINTPGLFENIRKSAIRSRKRLSENTGSDAKRARMDVQEDAGTFTSLTDDKNSSSSGNRQQKSPLNRLSDFQGVKKLMKTPPKSPKNRLTNFEGVKQLMKSPKTPKNRLSDFEGVDKLMKSPPKSPKNRLTNFSGVKKLLQTPKSPKNRLTNFEGVNKLMKTPKSPKNDLRNIPDLRRIMANSPKNDLTNISGVERIFNVSGQDVLHQGSDIENSEDLFTKLTGKKPIRAYTSRGRSLSPARHAETPAHRKTMGDLPLCSPRVQKWVEEHSNYVDQHEMDSGDKSQRMSENFDLGPGGSEDSLLENVSELPNKNVRTGRSLSAEKDVSKQKRRYTQGDALKRHSKPPKSSYDEELVGDLIENMPDKVDVTKRTARSLSARKAPKDQQRRVTQAYNLKLTGEELEDSPNKSRNLSVSIRKFTNVDSLKRTSSVKRELEVDPKPEPNLSARKSRNSLQNVSQQANKKAKLSLGASPAGNQNASMDLFDESSIGDLDNLPQEPVDNYKSRVSRSLSPRKSISRKSQGDRVDVSSTVVRDEEANSSSRKDVQIATVSSSSVIIGQGDGSVQMVEEPVQASKGRAAKKASAKKETKRKESVEEAPSSRGRKTQKTIEDEPVENLKKVQETIEEPVFIPEVQEVTRERRARGAQQKEVQEVAVKPRRGRAAQAQPDVTPNASDVAPKTKQAKETPVIPSDVEQADTETPVKSRRGRPKKVAKEIVDEAADTPTKGIKGKSTNVESAPKPKRGKALQEATPDIEASTRPKRGKAHKEESTPKEIEPILIVESDIEATPDVVTRKPRRGKAADKDTPDVEAKPRAKRGKAAVEATPDEVVSTRTRRGQKNIQPVEEEPSDVAKVPTRARRGKTAQKVVPETDMDAEEPEVVNKPLEAVKRGCMRKRVASQTDNSEVDSPTSPRSKRVRFERADSEEPKVVPVHAARRKNNENEMVVEEPVEVKKTARGRSKTRKVEDVAEPEPVVAKTTRARGRRNVKDDVPEEKNVASKTEEEEDHDEEVVFNRPVRTRGKKAVDDVPAKPARGKGKKIVEILPVEETVEAPAKSSRSNKGKKTVEEQVIVEDVEVPAKAAARGKAKKTAEEEIVVEVPAKSSRGKGKKHVETIEENPVEEAPKKSSRVNKGKKIVEEEFVVESPVKSTRGRAKKTVVEEQIVETKATRSKAQKAKQVEPEEVQSRPTRARARRN